MVYYLRLIKWPYICECALTCVKPCLSLHSSCRCYIPLVVSLVQSLNPLVWNIMHWYYFYLTLVFSHTLCLSPNHNLNRFHFFLKWISYLPTISTHFLNSIMYPKLLQTFFTCFTTKNKCENNSRYFAVLLGTHPSWRVCGVWSNTIFLHFLDFFSLSSFSVVILFIWNTAGFICFSLLVPSLLI